MHDLGLHQAVGGDRYAHEQRQPEAAPGGRPTAPASEVGALDVRLEEDVSIALVVVLVGVPEVGDGCEGVLVPAADLVLAAKLDVEPRHLVVAALGEGGE